MADEVLISMDQCRVGDRVWEPRTGLRGTIFRLDPNMPDVWVRFDNGAARRYRGNHAGESLGIYERPPEHVHDWHPDRSAGSLSFTCKGCGVRGRLEIVPVAEPAEDTDEFVPLLSVFELGGGEEDGA